MSPRQIFVAIALALASRTAAAADVGPPGEALSVETHGFVSPGFIVTTDNNYLAKSKRGSFEFTEVGMNFTVPLTDRLRTGMQLFAHDLGPVGNYTAKLDWYYLDYRFEDWLGLRAGRVKIPFGLYNDTSDIDAARVPVLLPQSIYSLQNRDLLLAQTGVEFYGRTDMRSLGALAYSFYGGTIFLDAATQSSVGTQVTSIDIPYVVGQRVMWETPVEGLRVGGSLQALRLDATFTVNSRPTSIELPAKLSVGSIEYSARDLLLAAEYSRWYVRVKTLDGGFPEVSAVSERGYGMVSYRVSNWFQPGAYYSLFYPDMNRRSGPAAMQHDVAATLRFDINNYWLVKLEGHFMSGTAGLNKALNDNKPLDTLERTWGVFLAKTTAHF